MTTPPSPKRLGFFTRLLDEASAAERYRLATQQIVQAERCGFDSAWIAQHHFHEGEGGLPAPFVFLAQAAVQTSRIRLGTGIVTLPLELPVRVAEDAAVTDLISGNRLEVGVGPGGNLTAFTAFGLDANDRHKLMDHNLELMRTAWAGGSLPGGDKLYPSSPTLVDRIWQATFTVAGARRAGLAGDGLMLSRTQPRSPDAPKASLADIQNPMIDAYLEALPSGNLVGDLIQAFDVHIGTPEEVIASLQADSTLERATDLTMQVHSIDPPHPFILRSIELMADSVAPALGWVRNDKAAERRVA